MMKKTIVIGDIHGRDSWKTFSDIDNMIQNITPENDFYIFLGDYVDPYDDISDQDIIHNLNQIIDLKNKFPNNVILLWGNHDIQYYLNEPNHAKMDYLFCSRYNRIIHIDLYNIFNMNKELFQFTFQYGNNLFSHAGVNDNWFNSRFKKQFDSLLNNQGLNESDYDSISDKLNLAFDHKLSSLFDICYARGGYFRVGGPFWLDIDDINEPVPGYNQYVGHNKVTSFKRYDINENTSITVCDTLSSNKMDYLKIEL